MVDDHDVSKLISSYRWFDKENSTFNIIILKFFIYISVSVVNWYPELIMVTIKYILLTFLCTDIFCKLKKVFFVNRIKKTDNFRYIQTYKWIIKH